MKRQYLGDSKDSFKWDYLDHLTASMPGACLRIAWMMTPDDGGADGKTNPELFPARREILDFCKGLQSSRDPDSLLHLPALTGRAYKVMLDSWGNYFTEHKRRAYFGRLYCDSGQVLFLDPDNGFEPERSYSEKHVLYRDVHETLGRIPKDSVITVFQHHRRKKFVDDFSRIRERLRCCHSTAIFWQSLMFVSISQSKQMIEIVRESNLNYSKIRPVNSIL
jgi:hypothetical protein